MKWDIQYLEWKGFDKNPQNINRNGRPRKGISLVNSELEVEWYFPASKSDIEINYMSLLNLPEERIEQLITDKSQPILIHVLAKSILSWRWFDILEKMLDRWIGKAKITEEIKHSGYIFKEDYSLLNEKELDKERMKLLN